MRAGLFFCLLAVGLSSLLAAQYDAAVFGSASYVVLFNSQAGKTTTIIAQSQVQSLRGGMFGPTGLIYTSSWTSNGIEVLDPQTGAWIAGLAALDSTNTIMGAPYQPAVNYDNLGAFGLFCVDGNSPNPASTLIRNTFVVDYSTSRPTFALDGIFSNTNNTPMSDMFPNPFGAGWVGIGFSTDQKIDLYPRAATPNTSITLTNLLTMPLPAQYDATFCEDGNFWVLASNNLMICDLRKQTASTIALQGVPAGYGGIWCAPWEQPGMKAWIACDLDDTIYAVDLLASPIVATSLVKFPFPAPLPHTDWAFNTGRSAEECQLCSWKVDLNGKRNFHVNFGGKALGQACVLVPSLVGLSRNPLMMSGLEIYLGVDTASILALQGFLPYVSVRYLGTSGEVDFVWNGFGKELGIRTYWQALTFTSNGKVTDASNIINVGI